MNKNMVSSLISKYAQVVLWFCRTGLLPEGSGNARLKVNQLESVPAISQNTFSHSVKTFASHLIFNSLSFPPDDDALQISRPFYTHSVISNYYTIRREELTRLAKWVVFSQLQYT